MRVSARRNEHFDIVIPRKRLGDDAPSVRLVMTPELGNWKNLIDEYVKTHPVGYQVKNGKNFMAARLECDSNFGPEIQDLGFGDVGTVTVRVTNKGNGISYAAYVQIYEGPWGYTHPLSDYRLCDYSVLTINPGQTMDAKLNWNRLLDKGRIVGVCFDPFLDPRGFHLVEQYHDHITSMHYHFPQIP